MADMNYVNIPTPPDKPVIEDMHKHMVDLNIWMNQNFGSGMQQTFLSQNQVNNISGNENLGKIHFNNDTGTFQGTVLSGSNLVVKNFTMA